jgi:hypothetical protein
MLTKISDAGGAVEVAVSAFALIVALIGPHGAILKIETQCPRTQRIGRCPFVSLDDHRSSQHAHATDETDLA